MGSDLITWFREQLDQDESAARRLIAAATSDVDDAGYMTGGWEFWGQYGRAAEPFCRPKVWLADIAAKRAVLDLHKPCHVESDPWSCTSGHYGSEGLGLDGTQPARCGTCVESWGEELTAVSPCGTVLALAQPYVDRPGFDPSWRAG